MKFLNMKGEGALLQVYVQPNATKTRIVGEHDARLKIALQAPPVDGAANEALLEFLAELLGVPQKKIELINGQKGRKKSVLIRGILENKIRTHLAEAMK